MSGNLDDNDNSHQNSNRLGMAVPIVFFGAFSAGISLMGTPAMASENNLRTRSLPEGVSEEAPKVTLGSDGSVVPESILLRELPAQPTLQPSPKQENSRWRVFVNEDGTLSILSADEVPDTATEVTCTADGICTPVAKPREAAISDDTTTATEAPTDSAVSTEADSTTAPGRYDS